MNNELENIKIDLQKYRILAHLNKAELARKIGVSKMYITQIENGDRIPAVKILVFIAVALNVEFGLLVLYNHHMKLNS